MHTCTHKTENKRNNPLQKKINNNLGCKQQSLVNTKEENN